MLTILLYITPPFHLTLLEPLYADRQTSYDGGDSLQVTNIGKLYSRQRTIDMVCSRNSGLEAGVLEQFSF